MSDAWVQTCLGKPFDLINPREEDVDPNDIIWHLARLARFSGATYKTGPGGCAYVVLQHCLLVMEILDSWGCPPSIIREGGWHECDEPYTGDLTRPLQLAVRAAFNEKLIGFLGKNFDLGPSAFEALKEIAHGLDPLQEVRVRVGNVARARLGLPEHETAIVKRADNVALAIEQRDLMQPCSRDWKLAEYAPRHITIEEVYDATTVSRMFRSRMLDIEQRIERDA